MNYFIEGLQGSGKSTLVKTLSDIDPELRAVREGDYSPVELAWCAYVSREKYEEILDKYSEIRPLIEEKSHEENGMMIICYTQIITDIPGFHKDLEQYEIYNNRKKPDEFKGTVLNRYLRWEGDNTIFECSLFQNTVEDMTLFRTISDDEIKAFYKEVRRALEGKEYRIIYLSSDDVKGNIDIIRKERSDDDGNELWFPLMMGFFNESPYAKKYGVSGEEELIRHFQHRQELELEICREIFSDRTTVLKSKEYDSEIIRSITHQ